MLTTIKEMAGLVGKTSIVGLGADYLTMVGHGETMSNRIFEIVSSIERDGHALGQTPKKYYNHGYTGFQYRDFSYGVKADAVVLNISGNLADIVLTSVNPVGFVVHRVDFQFTVKMDEPRPDQELWHFEEQMELHKKKRRHPSPKYVESPTGATLYLGKRGGTRLLRMYDKSLSYGEPIGLIHRYEVELRHELAERTAIEYHQANSRDTFLIGLVFDAFHRLCVRPPVDFEETPDVTRIIPEYKESDSYYRWARQTLSSVLRVCRNTEEGVQLLAELGIQTSYLNNGGD